MRSALSRSGLRARLAVNFAPRALPQLDDIEVVEFDPAQVELLPAPIAACVLDVDRLAIDVVVACCSSPRLSCVPKLLIGHPERLASILDVCDAEDTADTLEGIPTASLARRLRLLCDLGLTRLRESLLQQAFEVGVTGLSIADAHGDQPLLAVSRAFARLTGYDEDDALGRNCRFLRGSDPSDERHAHFRSELAQHHIANMLVRNYRKDGSPFWNDLTVFAFHAQGVRLPLLGGVQHDVTELVEARAANERLTRHLIEQQAFERAVLDGVDLGIVTTNVHGTVTFSNARARDLLAVPADELEHFDIRGALGIESDLDLVASASFSRTVMGADALVRDLQVTITRPEDSREALSFLFVLRDATEEKKMHAEMRRVERLAAMGTMVAGFAHEVRNPIASLRTMTEWLDEDLTEAGMRLPHAQRMLGVIARIERLVTTLLQFGRPSPPKPGPHRPWTLVSAALSMLNGRARELGGDIRVEVEPDLPDVFVDDGQMMQVLVILLNNALDAVGHASRVCVRAIGDRDREPRSQPRSQPPPARNSVRFEVVDDGPGVPADVAQRMFDPFFTTKPSGTGLGLSIAQQIVFENGARIELTSPRGPTIFTLECPVRPRS